ncbi:MAG: hypothetical protein IJQ58_12795, partial [Synergistaceae bacterium]|nr:hypothetical protein [Synergistaceae bacterium]
MQMKKAVIIFTVLLCFVSSAVSLPVYNSEFPPIVIQGAMKIETDVLISVLDESHDYTIGHWNYTTGKINGYPVVVSLTHCGTDNAAASTALAIETFR